MKLGACAGCTALDKIEILAKTGFDYVEIGFGDMAKRSDEEFEAFLAKLAELNFKCEAANSFVPGEIKLTGEEVDYAAVTEFVEKGMARAEKIGIKSVVFGSSGARNVPEGFPREKAYEQLVVFLRDYCGPISKKYGVNIAIEPLSTTETNIIFSVEDGVLLGRASGCDNVKGLADLYHMYNNNDDVDNIRKFPGEVIHSHIACGPTRNYPTPDDGFAYKPFVDALKAAGCERLSVEARSQDFAVDAKIAFDLLKALV